MGVSDSMWVSVTKWFTPTALFCILNLTIGTIFISSRFKHQKKHENHEHGSEGTSSNSSSNSNQLFRPLSLLERVKSINFSVRYRSDQPYPFPQVDSDEDREEHKAEEAHEVHSETHHVMRIQSETSVQVSKKGSATRKMMKKSASEKIVMTLDKEKEKEETEVGDRRRPATVRARNEKCSQTTTQEDDETVDEKADDFINRFRQQLKLQRLDSVIRYTEMLKRGSGR